VSWARRRVLRALDGLDREASESVGLAVSELVTNAFQHGAAPVRLVVDRTDDVVLVQVVDGGPRLPHLVPEPGPDGGWGLHLVARISVRWGVTELDAGPGKTVWAEVAVPNGAQEPG
jgi:anti-sigma regulatory factor (Ser/Thr protein kinase)